MLLAVHFDVSGFMHELNVADVACDLSASVIIIFLLLGSVYICAYLRVAWLCCMMHVDVLICVAC